MKRSSGPRKTATLPESTHHQLNAYALAASAAGVGALALVLPAQAKIIYTPVHENAIGVNLDLNNDGIADFKFCFSSISTSHHCGTSARRHRPEYFDALVVEPLNASNGIRGKGYFAFALAAGKQVKGIFPKNDYTMADVDCSGSCYYHGPWLNASGRYLGLKFVIKGKIHYGWARLNVNWRKTKAILTGYAYETIAGKGIIAGQTKEAADDPTDKDFGPDASLTNPIPDTPQPGSLAALAMGAPVLSIWRREELALAGATSHLSKYR